MKPFLCRVCGEDNPRRFETRYKGICSKCRRHTKRLSQRNYYHKWYIANGRNRRIDYAEAIREWQANHPDAVKAGRLLNASLKEGRLVKPIGCSRCGEIRRLSAHHEDYTKPLEVLWLCSSCHKLKHPA